MKRILGLIAVQRRTSWYAQRSLGQSLSGSRPAPLGSPSLWGIGLLLIFSLSACQTIKHLVDVHDPLNFHAVKEGELYRSAQPYDDDLPRVVEKHGIRSVINLRGAHPGQDWYDHELAQSEELGLVRVDIAMSARRLPHRADLLTLLDAFRDLPRPILIHCEAGADRTGEAVSIFGLEYLGWTKKQALRALHPYYGHFPDNQPAKTYFIREVYQDEDWVRRSYDPCAEDYRYYNREAFCDAPS